MITAASYQSNEPIGPTTYRVVIRLTDDVKGVYDQSFVLQGATAAQLRDDASTKIAALNAALSQKSVLDGIAVGFSIPVTAPTPPAPTAMQTFFSDLARWERVQAAIDAGILLGTEPEVTAFKAQVKSEYQSAFLASF